MTKEDFKPSHYPPHKKDSKFTGSECATTAKDVLQAIGISLVSDAKSFSVGVEMQGDTVTVLSMECAAQDMGILIGEGGKMFRSLLAIVGAIGHSKGEQITIAKIQPPFRPVFSRPRLRAIFDPNWSRSSVGCVAQAICSSIFNTTASATIRELPNGGIVEVSLDHPQRLEPNLLAAIRTVFTAIGIVHGCDLFIDFKKT